MPLPPYHIFLCFAPLFGVYTKIGIDPYIPDFPELLHFIYEF